MRTDRSTQPREQRHDPYVKEAYMSIIRVADDLPEKNFTIVRNAAIQDNHLSLRARGLLVYLLSLPPGWTTSTERLASTMPEGRDAIRRVMTELEVAGYVKRTRARDEGGRWAHTSWVSSVPSVPTVA